MAVFGRYLSKDIRYVVNEAYVGKTETLLEMEDAINKIRVYACNKFTDINKSKEVQRLNRLFEKQFGMDVFALNIDQSHVVNAYTNPINTRYDIAFKKNISDYVTGDIKTGYRFKEGNGLGIVATIYFGILDDPEYTDAEVLAILLHELGHNFADAISDNIKYSNIAAAKAWLILTFFLAIYMFWLGNIRQGLKYLFDPITNNNKYVKKQAKKKYNALRGIGAGIVSIDDDVNYFLNEVLYRFSGGLLLKLGKLGANEEKNKKYLKEKNAGRQNEVIADKFAGIYGYGPEQVSALLKMSKAESAAQKFVNAIPIIGPLLNKGYFKEFSNIHNFDVHPHVMQRAHSEINLLKDELAKADVDPKLAKIMKSQIKEIEDLIDKSTAAVEEGSKIDKMRAVWYATINKDDPDAVSPEVEKEIHKALDNALNKKGK